MIDLDLLQRPFFNLEAEQTYLACILYDGDLIKDSRLEPQHFSDLRHQKIFKTMRYVEGKGESVTIIAIITAAGKKVNEIGGTDYLSNLANSVPTTSDFQQCEKYILQAWKYRTAFEISRELQAELTSANEKGIDKAIDKLSNLSVAGVKQAMSFKDKLTEWYDDIEYRSTHDQRLTGVATGYEDLDVAMGGLQTDDLIIVGARPSIGKTSFALNLIMGAAQSPENENVIFDMYELEMRDKKMIDRMVSAAANIDSMYLRRPAKFFKDDTWQQVTFSLGQLSNIDFNLYDDPLVSVTEINAQTRHRRRENPDAKIIIVIDYLQLIQTSGDERYRVGEIGKITRQLKIMARNLHVTVILLSQLSRGVESRQDKRPMLSDLRDSGNIEQDADVVMFLYRDDYYNRKSDKKNIIEINIAKQRNGATGTFELAFIKEYNKFVNIERSVSRE